MLFRLRHVGHGTNEPFNADRLCFPSGCVKEHGMAFLPQSEPLHHCRYFVRSEDLSFLVELSVNYLGRWLIISVTVFSAPVALLTM